MVTVRPAKFCSRVLLLVAWNPQLDEGNPGNSAWFRSVALEDSNMLDAILDLVLALLSSSGTDDDDVTIQIHPGIMHGG